MIVNLSNQQPCWRFVFMGVILITIYRFLKYTFKIKQTITLTHHSVKRCLKCSHSILWTSAFKIKKIILYDKVIFLCLTSTMQQWNISFLSYNSARIWPSIIDECISKNVVCVGETFSFLCCDLGGYIPLSLLDNDCTRQLGHP